MALTKPEPEPSPGLGEPYLVHSEAVAGREEGGGPQNTMHAQQHPSFQAMADRDNRECSQIPASTCKQWPHHQCYIQTPANREEEGVTRALHTCNEATLESNAFPEKGDQGGDQQSPMHMPQMLPSIQPVAEEEEESSVEGDG
jgi:hypothetical protein